MKKIIVGIIIGVIISGTIGVLASTIISSSNVTYQNKTVKESLDELYSKATKYREYQNGDVVYYNPETNKRCSAKESNSQTGTKTGCMKWYTFNDEGANSSTVNMILDHNTTAGVAWNSTGRNSEMKEAANALTKDTQSWNSSLNARLITANEVAKITGNSSFSGITSTGDSWFCFDTNQSDSTNLCKKVQGASKNAWLFDYTNGCTNHGCNIEESSTYGYWTSSVVAGSSSSAWHVNRNGNLGSNSVVTTHDGIRPVITISKKVIS